MALRVVRAFVGLVLLLIGLPLLLAGGGLWLVAQHRDDGAYRAPLADIAADGHAIVASDLDSLLRTDAPFVRAGQTTLRVTAHTDTGPAFIGLAPAERVADYLAGVPHAEVEQVRLARGPLPVSVVPVQGTALPEDKPEEQRFWLAASSTGSLEWTPSEFRGEPVSLVIMRPEGGAPLSTNVVADLRPQWLTSATFGALVLGGVLALVGIAALIWTPRARSRSREIVYVVPPAQVPELAAHLGVPAPPTSTEHDRSPVLTPGRLDPVPATGGVDLFPATGEVDPERLEWPPTEVGAPEIGASTDSTATPDLDPWTDPDADPDHVQSALDTDPDGADPDGAGLAAVEPDAEEVADSETDPVDLVDAEPEAVELAVPVSETSDREAAEPEDSELESAARVAEATAAETGSDPEIVEFGEVQVGTAGVGSDRVATRVVAPRLATASLPPPWPPPAQPWVTAEPAPVPELQKTGHS